MNLVLFHRNNRINALSNSHKKCMVIVAYITRSSCNAKNDFYFLGNIFSNREANFSLVASKKGTLII